MSFVRGVHLCSITIKKINKNLHDLQNILHVSLQPIPATPTRYHSPIFVTIEYLPIYIRRNDFTHLQTELKSTLK